MRPSRSNEQDQERPDERRNPLVVRVAILARAGVTLLACLMVATALGGFIAPLDLASHFQVQYLWGALACLVLCIVVRRWRWALLAAVITGLAAVQVVPWYLPVSGGQTPRADAGAGAARIRVLLVNVLRSNGDRAAVDALVRSCDPDVLVLQEVDDAWMRALEATASRYPYSISAPRGDNFGIALFSRLPLERESIAYFGPLGLPSVVASLDVDGEPVTIVSTHPFPPATVRRTGQRNAQLAEVAQFVDGVHGPVLLVGDLNVSMWSAPYRRLVAETGLLNARRSFGVLPSWSMQRPWFMRIPIDHCLHSDHFRVVGCATGPETGSDHLPLIVDLELPPLGQP